MLRLLLHENSILSDIKDVNFESVLASFSTSLPRVPLSPFIDPKHLHTQPLRDGVSLSVGICKKLTVPQMVLFISRWGVIIPSGNISSLLFFLFLPDNMYAEEIQSRVRKEIERIVCDRFILERVRISETSEEVLEILLREHGVSREVASAS